MKKIVLVLAILTMVQSLQAQSIGIGTTTPHSSAMLDIVSNTSGLLVPRMSSTDRTNIATPATGLLVFDTDFGDFWFYNGSVWVEITTAAAGTNYWTLAFNNITNNNSGNVGIGIAGSGVSEKFQVDANMKVGNAVWTSGNDRIIKFGDGAFVTIGETGQDDRMTLAARNFIFTPSSSYPGYIGINTTSPSAPLSFGNIIGEKINFWNTDATHNYGIGVQGGILQIHTNDASADIAFGSGISSTGAGFTETMRIKGNGNVGIGTNNPVSPLSFSNAFGDKVNLLNVDAVHNSGLGIQSNLLQVHTENSSSDIVFGYGSSSSLSENMRIKGTGNVGIGINNPLEKLSVLSLFSAFGISHTDGSIKLATYIGFPAAGADGAWLGTTSNNSLYFFTNNPNPGNTTPAMSITSSGTVGIGTGNPTVAAGRKLEIKSSSNVYTRITTTNSNSASVGLEFCYTGSASAVQDWRIRTSSSVGSTNLYFESSSDHFVSNHPSQYEFYDVFFVPGDDNVKSLGSFGSRWTEVFATNGVINTSDRREKENIKDLNYGIKEVMQLRPVSFSWIKNPQQGIKLGFIAQDVEPVIAEAVTKPQPSPDKKGGDGLYGLNYSELIPVLTKAIQEQEIKIEVQEKQIKELEKIVAALRHN